MNSLDQRPATGRRAETLAAELLEGIGFRIVARNWRVPEGEIDIVAFDGDVCVFVEVRSRTGEAHGHPVETVTARKRAHVVRSAALYLAANPTGAAAFRFDVVAVLFRPDRGPPDLTHVRAAFETR